MQTAMYLHVIFKIHVILYCILEELSSMYLHVTTIM